MRLSAFSLLAASIPVLFVAGADASQARARRDASESGPRVELDDGQRRIRPAPRQAEAPRRAGLVDASAKRNEDLGLIPRGARPAAPPFPKDLEWIRMVPIQTEMLRGRVVLVEVWESNCINCLRSLPLISRLHKRYSDFGFLAIGIHSPEFNFSASKAAVERASHRFGLDFPIASDTRKSFWNTWGVAGWPTTYLLDIHGMLASIHTGEFTSSAMERRLRALLRERWPDLRFADGDRLPPDEDPYGPECGFVTPDIMTTPNPEFLLNTEGLPSRGTIIYADPGNSRSEGSFYLRGPWSWLDNGLQRGADPAQASIGVTYTAKEVYAVLANSSQIIQDIEIRQDGKPLTPATRGADVVFAENGRSFLRLAESRLYYLVVNSESGRHDIELFPRTAGFQIHSFSFGNSCQTKFPHR